MTIDVHTHYFPEPVADMFRSRTKAPWIERVSGGGERLHLPVNVLAFTEDYLDMDARLAFMDRMGVDAQLLSLAGLFGADSLPVEEAQPICETFNTEAAALHRSHPERFACLAALPFADMDTALAEYRRGRELGLAGAVLPMNFFDSLEQAERLRPLFDLAEALGGHLFLHPGPRPDQRPDLKAGAQAPFSDNGVYRSSLEVQNKVGQAMVTLLMTDFLDGYGNLTVHVANLAGTLPAVVERLDHLVITRDPDAPMPSSMMKRVAVDCSSFGTETIEFAAKFIGAEHILLGTDCPIFRTDRTISGIEATRLSAPEKQAILHGNAVRLLSGVWPALGES